MQQESNQMVSAYLMLCMTMYRKQPCKLGVSCIFIHNGCIQHVACCDGSAGVSGYGAVSYTLHFEDRISVASQLAAA